MSWNLLTPDEHDVIARFALRPSIEAKVCLQDDWCYDKDYREENCVAFLDVEGTWLSNDHFACTLDTDSIPAWVEDESALTENWMRFALRRRLDGALLLPDGDAGGKWIEVGRVKRVAVPVSRWHGVMKKTSETKCYNCIFYDGVCVHAGCDEFYMPGYYVSITGTPNRRGQSAGGPFNAVFE